MWADGRPRFVVSAFARFPLSASMTARLASSSTPSIAMSAEISTATLVLGRRVFIAARGGLKAAGNLCGRTH
jgi:hypothetical protein